MGILDISTTYLVRMSSREKMASSDFFSLSFFILIRVIIFLRMVLKAQVDNFIAPSW